MLICQERISYLAANDAQASTGSSHDDESTASSNSAADAPIGFYNKRLAAWLTLYDQKVYLKRTRWKVFKLQDPH